MQHKNFFMVPNRIFDLELKPRDFTVYCCLLRHSDSKDGSCFPSRRVIAKECGMDRKTVDSAVENLSSLGLVKKIQRHREDGTRTSNLYYVASFLQQSRSFVGVVSEFPIKKKTHRTKLRNYYNRKREQTTPTNRRVSPTDRLCVEERRDARKHPTKRKPPVGGDLRARLERQNEVGCKAAFRHFRWVENQAGERVGVVNAPRLGSQRTATPTAQGFSGFWKQKNIGVANEALCQYTVPQIPKSAVFKGKTQAL